MPLMDARRKCVICLGTSIGIISRNSRREALLSVDETGPVTSQGTSAYVSTGIRHGFRPITRSRLERLRSARFRGALPGMNLRQRMLCAGLGSRGAFARCRRKHFGRLPQQSLIAEEPSATSNTSNPVLRSILAHVILVPSTTRTVPDAEQGSPFALRRLSQTGWPLGAAVGSAGHTLEM